MFLRKICLFFVYFIQTAAAAKPAQYTGTYQANATGYTAATYAQPAVQTTIAAQPTTQAKRKYLWNRNKIKINMYTFLFIFL